MSNHFTGLSLGPPLGDQRLDLYAFQSPADKNRTVMILNAVPNADALHPDAIHRLFIRSFLIVQLYPRHSRSIKVLNRLVALKTQHNGPVLKPYQGLGSFPRVKGRY